MARVNELRAAYLMCATCGCDKMGLGPTQNEMAQGRHKADPPGSRHEGPRRIVRHNKTNEIAVMLCGYLHCF